MKPGTFGLIAALGCAAAACSSTPDQTMSPDPAEAVVTAQVGQNFELRPGQTANVGSLVVGFRGVSKDSRCPTDVTCVWAGDAEVVVPVTVGRMAFTSLTLHTGLDPRSTRFREYTITVVGLTPAPHSGREIPSASYALTLKVE